MSIIEMLVVLAVLEAAAVAAFSVGLIIVLILRCFIRDY